MFYHDDTPERAGAGHADYPHAPGQLYGCAACESCCFCEPGSTQCVACALIEEWEN